MTSQDDLNRIDRALQAALTPDPSPAFLPGVRSRMADTQPQRSWRAGWLLVPAAVVIAALVTALQLRQQPPSPHQPPERVANVAPAAAASPVIAERTTPASTQPVASTLRPVARTFMVRATSRTEPEVLMPAREKVAWREFLQLAEQGAIEMEPTTVLENAPIQPIEIAAVQIAPLSDEGY